MKNLESAIEKFQSKVKGLNFQSKDPLQLNGKRKNSHIQSEGGVVQR